MAYIDKTFWFDQDDREVKIQNPTLLSEWSSLTLRWRLRSEWDKENYSDDGKFLGRHDFDGEKFISIELWPYISKAYGDLTDKERKEYEEKEREIMLTVSEALKLSQKLQMAVNEIITEYQIESNNHLYDIEYMKDILNGQISKIKQKEYEYEKAKRLKEIQDLKLKEKIKEAIGEKDNSKTIPAGSSNSSS